MQIKKRLSVNVICFIIAGLLLAFFFGAKAFADMGDAGFRSRGNFDYLNGAGEVYLCADDFNTIYASLEKSDRLLNAV